MLLSQLLFEPHTYTYTRHDEEKGMESKRCCMLYPCWYYFKAGCMSIFPCSYIPHLLPIDLWFGEFVHQLLVLFPIRTGDLKALCNTCVGDTSQSSNRLENLCTKNVSHHISFTRADVCTYSRIDQVLIFIDGVFSRPKSDALDHGQYTSLFARGSSALEFLRVHQFALGGENGFLDSAGFYLRTRCRG